MPEKLNFDPDKVAYFEKAGWQAYYDRKWLRVLSLMIHTQYAVRITDQPSPDPPSTRFLFCITLEHL